MFGETGVLSRDDEEVFGENRKCIYGEPVKCLENQEVFWITSVEFAGILRRDEYHPLAGQSPLLVSSKVSSKIINKCH